ncbi:translation initiation factor IF-2-like [Camelus ferus]|uniref:Translation initiation factor IF-2-like n=1 Tax=Camelus ferus TaxID=419612 RepID=A0A8B8T2Z1_CAMFR|nr:uncharacterized protein LOC116153131 [Camelus dromedarius]XP_032336408.1 translation initiation factor IF-2-like [Camelus ferus]
MLDENLWKSSTVENQPVKELSELPTGSGLGAQDGGNQRLHLAPFRGSAPCPSSAAPPGPPGPAARALVPAAPARPSPAAWTPTGRPAAAAAGSGVRRGDRSGAGLEGASSPPGGMPDPGASRPPSWRAPSAGACWHRRGRRGREEGGGVGSVRPACLGPEGSPSATCF